MEIGRSLIGRAGREFAWRRRFANRADNRQAATYRDYLAARPGAGSHCEAPIPPFDRPNPDRLARLRRRHIGRNRAVREAGGYDDSSRLLRLEAKNHGRLLRLNLSNITLTDSTWLSRGGCTWPVTFPRFPCMVGVFDSFHLSRNSRFADRFPRLGLFVPACARLARGLLT